MREGACIGAATMLQPECFSHSNCMSGLPKRRNVAAYLRTSAGAEGQGECDDRYLTWSAGIGTRRKRDYGCGHCH